MNGSVRRSTESSGERAWRDHRSQRGSVRITTPLVVMVVAGLVALVMGVLALTGGEGPDASDRSDPSGTTHRDDVTGGSDDVTRSNGNAVADGNAVAGGGAGAQQERLAALARLDPEDPVARGSLDAPVVVINYSDFQCQYCRRFVLDTEAALVERYVDTGLVRIEWRDFPWIGNESTAAAHAARAAAAQGRFWEYNEALYEDQPSKTNSGAWSDDRLVELAGTLGMDPQRFRGDMNDPATTDAVAADFAEGQRIGVTGTPTFLINGQPLIGAYPLEVFTQVIDEELARLGVPR